MKKTIVQNPNIVKDFLSIDNIDGFANNLKTCIKYYSKGIELSSIYIDDAVLRAYFIAKAEGKNSTISKDILIDLVLSLGFWARWAPEDCDFDNLANNILNLVINSNSFIRASALASLGFLWQRIPEYTDDWMIFSDAFLENEPIIKIYSLFGIHTAIQNPQNMPPDYTIESLLDLLEDSDSEIREEAALIIHHISKHKPEKLIPYRRRIEYRYKSGINNMVIRRLKKAIANINDA
ncbi:MAG: hypothetical protein ACLFSQ_10415 [Candidatus Zixiibacteriota bacterium]